MRLGIDVGGTNTDAVLISDHGELLATAKRLTTADILTGMEDAVTRLLRESDLSPDKIKGVFIGTTHVLNALYTQKELARTALIRISKHESLLQPAIDWTESLKRFIRCIHHVKSHNGYFGIGKTNDLNFNLQELFQTIETGEIDSICIVGSYSPMYEQEELLVKHEISRFFPDIPITVSNKLGSIGYIERENAALLNAILSKVIRRALEGLSAIFKKIHIHCPYWIIQNNGSLMQIEEAIDYPILTIGSGMANSMRGASILTGYKDFIVVDFGGSTIDIGLVKNNSPIEVPKPSILKGTNISVPMPAFTSIPLGGGSIVSANEDNVVIGSTVANDIETSAIAWGGDTWTVTDSFLKVYPESFFFEDLPLKRLDRLDENDCRKVIQTVLYKLKETIERLTVNEENLPIVLVGGGSPLLDNRLFSKYKKVRKPVGYHISNAIGACFAQVSEQIDKVYWLHKWTKEEVLKRAVEDAKEAVVRKGGKPESVRMAYLEEYPFDYLQGEVLRVRTKAIGELSL